MTATIEIPNQFEVPQFRKAKIEQIDDRIIQLRAVPYDVEAEIDRGLFESFEPGAFAAAAKDPARVKLWFIHSNDGGRPVGQAMDIEDRADGLIIRAKVSATTAGDELHTLATDGVLDEASIEFKAIPRAMTIRRHGNEIHVRHRRGHLKGVALVPEGAYGRDARVLSVRDIRVQHLEKARAEALAALDALNH